jgi:hypothetical protein
MTQLYQRRRLATGEDLGAPEPLPAFLVGWPDVALADVSATAAQAALELGVDGLGFFPFTPEPPPPPEPRPVDLNKTDFLRLFTNAELATILAAAQADPMVAVYQYKLSQAEVVRLSDPDLVAGLPALEAAQLLAPGRAAQILAGEAP